MGDIFTFDKRVILQELRYLQQIQGFKTVGTYSEIFQITWKPGMFRDS